MSRVVLRSGSRLAENPYPNPERLGLNDEGGQFLASLPEEVSWGDCLDFVKGMYMEEVCGSLGVKSTKGQQPSLAERAQGL